MRALLPQPKIIYLGGPEKIIFDHRDGLYRGARYATVKLRNGKEELTRMTAKADKLEHLFTALFAKEHVTPEVREIIDYVHATEWGAKLP